MKKLLATLLLTAAASQATVIQWYRSNDAKGFYDVAAADGVYTGKVTDVEYNDGSFTEFDNLVGAYTLIDVNANKFLITTSANPVVAPANVLFSGDFEIDITSTTLDPNALNYYTLTNLTVNNTIGSAALDEFAATIALYPGAVYDFSMIGQVGNGQVATVPEPASLGLMGLGLVGLGLLGSRRRKA